MRAPARERAISVRITVVVHRRPARADRPPAVEEVADQVDHLGVVPLEEVEHPVGAAAVGAQVHVGQEQAAVAALRRPGLGGLVAAGDVEGDVLHVLEPKRPRRSSARH